jgi:L-rhamnose-H+ transport protein
VKGLAVAIFAGIMSSFFAFGLAAGKPIGDLTHTVLVADHRMELWANLPVLIVVLWGGFVTNLRLVADPDLAKNKSFAQFGGAPGDNPMGTAAVTGETLVDFDPRDYIGRINPGVLTLNYLFAAAAGVIWYFQFFFYSMGRRRWASTTSPAGRCTWPASSSSPTCGASC